MHNGPGRLLSDCLATFFFPQRRREGGGGEREERESNRVQADRQLTDVIGTSSRLGGSVRMLGDNLWRIDPLFGSE